MDFNISTIKMKSPMNKKGQLKVILAAFLQGIVIFMMVEWAYGQNWVFVGETENIKLYYDKDNISYPSKNIVRFCEKRVSIPSQNIKDYIKKGESKRSLINKGHEQYSHKVVYTECNCKEKTFMYLSQTDFDIQGSVLRTLTFSEKDKDSIMPDSIGDSLFKVVCK